MAYKFYDADGNAYAGDFPDSISIPFSKDVEGGVVIEEITASEGDSNYEDVLVAWMYMRGYIPVWVEAKENETAIIAFNLEDDENLKTLVLEYGTVSISDLHMTLMFLGNTSDLDKERVLMAVRGIAKLQAPISGRFNGYAVFSPNAENDDKEILVALYDSPQLPYLRSLIRGALMSEESYFPQDHGFTPHVTLAYLENVKVPDIPILYPKMFMSIWLYWGDQHYEFPLEGTVIEKQLPIDDASKARLMSVRQSVFNNDVDALAERVFTGDISIGQWEESMKKMIRELHSSMAAIGKGGWGNMTWSDWGRVGSVVKEQYRYLHGFAEKIASDRDTISLKAIQARSHLYGSGGGVSSTLIQAGQSIAKLLPWIPKDGSTECLVNCKCYWSLEVVGSEKDFSLVQATWNLSPAEHCDDCLDRDGYVTVIRVHKSVEVPSRIGGY